MDIYYNSKLKELNNIELYKEGVFATEKALEIAKKMKPIDKKYNIFVYWIGDNVNYKHSVVLKSFLATQNQNNATLKIYSDKEISNKEVFKEYKNIKNIEFHHFDVEEEIKNTIYENFQYSKEIKNHKFNAAYESDFFRILMLYKYGGFYIDFDVLLLRDLSPLTEYDFLYQWGHYPNNMINGAIMHLKKESPINNYFSELLLSKKATPGIGNLSWASDLYLEVKNKYKDLVIFPAAFFNTEWQSGICSKANGLLEPFKEHDCSSKIFDGAFSWHWHNRWEEPIEKNSKFNLLDEKLSKILKTNNSQF